MVFRGVFIIWLLLFGQLSLVFAGGYGVNVNLTDFLRHRRQKRGLIFNNGGAAQFVIGLIQPITLADPIEWRSLICLYNIHVGNYNMPSMPLYPCDKWENLYQRSGGRGRAQVKTDESREFLYLVMENYMTARHGHGRECLLRAICENAQVHHHVDLYAEILNVILTPANGDVDAIYSQAYEVGKAGADCFDYFSQCPQGLNFLDEFIQNS